jgi:Flp pilus assembly protein TadB
VSGLVLVLVGLLMAAVFVGVYFMVPRSAPSRPVQDARLQQRLSESNSAVTGFALRSADQMISKRSRIELESLLTIAGISLRPAEWRVLQPVVAVLIGVLGYVLSGLLLAIVCAGLGLLATRLWLGFKVSAARRRFEEDLPDLLQLLSSSLRSGLSLPAALEVVVVDGREPMVGEIRRLLSRARLGEPIEVGFGEIADRMRSQDFEWVALAVQIQKEVGGNLAEILKTTADTIRERAYLKRQVRTLSAEGKLSAYILIVLPFLVGGWVAFSNPDYLRPLWTTWLGLLMSAFGVVSLVVGWFWMRAVVRIQP